MVVAEQGSYHLGETVRLTVTSVLQTSAGRMIFGKIDPTGSIGKGPNHVGPPGHHENPAPAPGGRTTSELGTAGRCNRISRSGRRGGRSRARPPTPAVRRSAPRPVVGRLAPVADEDGPALGAGEVDLGCESAS